MHALNEAALSRSPLLELGIAPRAGERSVRAIAPARAPHERTEHRLLGGGATVKDEDVDGAGEALELRIVWDATLLGVHRVERNASFFAGDPELTKEPVDLALSAAVLGAARVPIVLGGRVVVSPSASVCVIEGDASVSLDELRTRGDMSASDGSAGEALAVPRGREVALTFGSITVEVTRVRNARRLRAPLFAFTKSAALAYVLGSAVAHGGVLASLAFFTPDLGGTTDDAIPDEQRYLVMRYLDDAAMREEDASKASAPLDEAKSPASEGGTGQRSKGSEGAMGGTANKGTGRWAAAGDAKETVLGRDAMLREAANFGAIGLINGGGSSDPNAPTVPWGGLVTEGMDAISANGTMWGEGLGAGRGMGGLGLTGIGEGGGGFGEGLGLGPIGTYGHGSGIGIGQGIGNCRTCGPSGKGHRVASPIVRLGPTTASGRIPPEVIQRAVRMSHGRFRACYESALRNNPSLQGSVTVRFVIARDGSVQQAGGGGSMPDAGVTSCVARAFYGLSFPSGDGVVTVGYTITFTPAS